MPVYSYRKYTEPNLKRSCLKTEKGHNRILQPQLQSSWFVQTSLLYRVEANVRSNNKKKLWEKTLLRHLHHTVKAHWCNLI